MPTPLHLFGCSQHHLKHLHFSPCVLLLYGSREERTSILRSATHRTNKYFKILLNGNDVRVPFRCRTWLSKRYKDWEPPWVKGGERRRRRNSSLPCSVPDIKRFTFSSANKAKKRLYKHCFLPVWRANTTLKQPGQLWETPTGKKELQCSVINALLLIKGTDFPNSDESGFTKKVPPHPHSRPGGVCTGFIEHRCKLKTPESPSKGWGEFYSPWLNRCRWILGYWGILFNYRKVQPSLKALQSHLSRNQGPD